MDETVSLFKRVVSELEKEWNPEVLKNTFDDKWDHVLLQCFFARLGRKLGFDVACERNRKWDVAWASQDYKNHVEVEIELHARMPIAKAFSKICKVSDSINQFQKEIENFSGILVTKDCLLGQVQNKDFFFDNLLNPKFTTGNIYYPQNRALDILIIDIGKKAYRYAKVGPRRKHGNVIDGTF